MTTDTAGCEAVGLVAVGVVLPPSTPISLLKLPALDRERGFGVTLPSISLSGSKDRLIRLNSAFRCASPGISGKSRLLPRLYAWLPS